LFGGDETIRLIGH